VSKEAVQEAIEKMMPEKNLISVRNDKVTYSPSQDYLMGLHYASKDPANEKVQRFATKEDAVQAYRKGLIRVDTPVKIG
jgi:DNA-directed RNA polymerase beta' subunit